MTNLARLFLGASGILALAAVLSLAPQIEPQLPHTAFPPDLLNFVSAAPDLGQPILAIALSGAIFGAALAFALTRAIARMPAASFLFIFANPLVLLAILSGPRGMLAFAAALVVWRAVVALAADQNHGATVSLGIALGVAPILSNAILALYPTLLIVLPFFSPWGSAPRRLAGFMTALAAPPALAAASFAYLCWLFAIPLPAGPMVELAPLAASSDYFLIVIGGLTVAIASRVGSRWALAVAFLASTALIVLLKPEFAAQALSVIRG